MKYHSVPSQQQDVWPVATRKWQPVNNEHHCKYNLYLCWFIFPFVLELFAHHYNTVYKHNMTFEMSLLFWNFCKCNVDCTFLFLYFTKCLSISLALAMQTYVSHANKALKLYRNWNWEGVSVTAALNHGICGALQLQPETPCCFSKLTIQLSSALWPWCDMFNSRGEHAVII